MDSEWNYISQYLRETSTGPQGWEDMVAFAGKVIGKSYGWS